MFYCGQACLNTNRKCVLIEKDLDYYNFIKSNYSKLCTTETQNTFQLINPCIFYELCSPMINYPALTSLLYSCRILCNNPHTAILYDPIEHLCIPYICSVIPVRSSARSDTDNLLPNTAQVVCPSVSKTFRLYC